MDFSQHNSSEFGFPTTPETRILEFFSIRKAYGAEEIIRQTLAQRSDSVLPNPVAAVEGLLKSFTILDSLNYLRYERGHSPLLTTDRVQAIATSCLITPPNLNTSIQDHFSGVIASFPVPERFVRMSHVTRDALVTDQSYEALQDTPGFKIVTAGSFDTAGACLTYREDSRQWQFLVALDNVRSDDKIFTVSEYTDMLAAFTAKQQSDPEANISARPPQQQIRRELPSASQTQLPQQPQTQRPPQGPRNQGNQVNQGSRNQSRNQRPGNQGPANQGPRNQGHSHHNHSHGHNHNHGGQRPSQPLPQQARPQQNRPFQGPPSQSQGYAPSQSQPRMDQQQGRPRMGQMPQGPMPQPMQEPMAHRPMPQGPMQHPMSQAPAPQPYLEQARRPQSPTPRGSLPQGPQGPMPQGPTSQDLMPQGRMPQGPAPQSMGQTHQPHMSQQPMSQPHPQSSPMQPRMMSQQQRDEAQRTKRGGYWSFGRH